MIYVIAIAILFCFCLPKVKAWFEHRASVARQREFLRTYLPIPHLYAPIEEWQKYLGQVASTDATIMAIWTSSSCNKKTLKPREEYAEVYQLIVDKLLEFGYNFKPLPHSRFELNAI